MERAFTTFPKSLDPFKPAWQLAQSSGRKFLFSGTLKLRRRLAELTRTLPTAGVGFHSNTNPLLTKATVCPERRKLADISPTGLMAKVIENGGIGGRRRSMARGGGAWECCRSEPSSHIKTRGIVAESAPNGKQSQPQP